MPAAVAIPSIIGAAGVGGSIFSGISGSRAATKASQIQADAARVAGEKAVAAAKEVNPQITEAARQAGLDVKGAAKTAGEGVTTAAAGAGQGVTDATAKANALLNPYATTGEAADASIRAGLAPGGAFSKTPTAADIQMDPGFAARLKLGLTQLDRTAAARGGSISGTNVMGLEDYRQTTASSEFDKAYQRFLDTRKQNFDFANTAAGRGASVAGVQGSNLIGSGKYVGDLGVDASKYKGNLDVGATEYAGDKTYGAATTTAANTLKASGVEGEYGVEGANAQAAGVVGRANAITGAIGQGIGAVSSAGNLYARLKNPISFGAPYKYGNMNTEGGPG